MRFAVIGVVFFGALAVILTLGVLTGSMPTYEKLADFLAADHKGQRVQIYGRIASIESGYPLEFTIEGTDNPAVRMRVRSAKAPPENFRPGVKVGLRGDRYDRETNTFHAYQIQTSCPSKYEPPGAGGKAGEAARDARDSGSPPVAVN
jgi:cytochrome c-type biogenesis protein CcmE